MTVAEVQGDLFAADVDALVNPVNTVGVMGKGLALEFKRRFPANFRAYEEACRSGALQLGRVLVHAREEPPRFIINFPTKQHWRGRSELRHIEAGMEDLVRTLDELSVQSIAIPRLGSGLGGLNWDVVRPVVLASFEARPAVRVLLVYP